MKFKLDEIEKFLVLTEGWGGRKWFGELELLTSCLEISLLYSSLGPWKSFISYHTNLLIGVLSASCMVSLVREREVLIVLMFTDLLNLVPDNSLLFTLGVEFPEQILEFLFLWVTLAYLGSSTLVSVMLLSKVFVQVLVLVLVISSDFCSEEVRIAVTAGSGGELELGSGSGSEECCWLRLRYSEQT